MKTQELFKWSSATFSLVPGLVVVLTNIGVPPTISKLLLGGIIEALGALTFILLKKNRKYIDKLPGARITRLSITCIVVFFISFLLYILLSGSQVIHSDEFSRDFFFPFWYGKDLRDMIVLAGTKLNIVHAFGPAAVDDAINNSTPFTGLTLLIFIFLYTVIFESLIIAFGLPGFRNAAYKDIL